MPIDPRRVLCSYEVIDILNGTGWPRDVWATAAAVFRAESGWDPRATSYQPNADGSIDRGIVQLNSRYFPDQELAFDPVRAIAKALELYRGRKFGPWYAYSNGSYRQFLPECEAAVEGRTLPYPGRACVVGSAGVPSRTVTFVLRRRGWRGCPLSSVYTTTVRDVVFKFQAEKQREGRNIGSAKPDGKVGPSTWPLLWEAPVT